MLLILLYLLSSLCFLRMPVLLNSLRSSRYSSLQLFLNSSSWYHLFRQSLRTVFSFRHATTMKTLEFMQHLLKAERESQIMKTANITHPHSETEQHLRSKHFLYAKSLYERDVYLVTRHPWFFTHNWTTRGVGLLSPAYNACVCVYMRACICTQ